MDVRDICWGIFRHAQIGKHGLTSYGQSQASELAELISPHLTGLSRIKLLSSKERSAVATAEFVNERLTGSLFPVKQDAFWYSRSMSVLSIEGAIRRLIEEQSGMDCVLIISHLEWTRELPFHFVQKILQKGWPEIPYPDYAEGFLILPGAPDWKFISRR